MQRQASRPLAYENYHLRSSNEFVLKDKTLRKGTQIDKNNRLISENPKRSICKRKKLLKRQNSSTDSEGETLTPKNGRNRGRSHDSINSKTVLKSSRGKRANPTEKNPFKKVNYSEFDKTTKQDY
jgi:hypothetical protein